MKPISREAYNLFHEGQIVFAEIEKKGIRVDLNYLIKEKESISNKILKAERTIWKTKEMRKWKSVSGSKTNIDSNIQLSHLLFKRLKYRPTKETKRGNPAVDDEVLRKIGTPFTKAILVRRKLLKVKDTYLERLIREQVDGFFHPTYNLCFVKTYRSSSDFQNIPVRDPEQGKPIRSAIIPYLPTDIIGEIDISGAEVSISACYHKDPTMLEYILDPTKDMHRDMAAECYLLDPKDVDKETRYYGKNGFVFPEFYGSYYAQVAPNLWDASKELKANGKPMRDHLRSVDIENLDQFTSHIQEVEDKFWNETFPVYTQWKKDWYKAYLKRGYFDMLTGFRCSEPMRKNDCINYPVQGVAFHCLLWGLIQLHRWLAENKMKTKILGQIHDSIILNFAPDEVQTVLRKAKKIFGEEIRKHWKWIIIPLCIEVELSPPGKSWNEKAPACITCGSV